MDSKIVFALVIVFALSGLGYSHCGSCGTGDKDAEKTGHSHSGMEQSMHKKQTMMNGTMEKVYDAEHLYTCPMHPEVVAVDKETKCPLCNMNLAVMSDKDVKKLRSDDLKGSQMHPIVVKKESDVENCPVCEMKLVEIEPKKSVEETHPKMR